MKPVEEVLAKIEATRLKALERQLVEVPATTVASAVMRLPPWPDDVRGVPNSVLRSALFGAIKRGRRTFLQRQPVGSYDSVTILQTGPRLDQADLDVWEQCMHLARTGGLGTRLEFSAHGFLRSIGRSTGKSQHEWLKGAFARLASSVVEIKDGKRAYFGPMLHHGTRDDETHHYVIEINPAIAALYGSDGWSGVEVKQRRTLKGQPLAQWLHGFYTTHAEPFPLKVETLYRLSGSEAKEIKHFKPVLREALEKLAEATSWTCSLDEKDLVRVVKERRRERQLSGGAKARHSTDRGTA